METHRKIQVYPNDKVHPNGHRDKLRMTARSARCHPGIVSEILPGLRHDKLDGRANDFIGMLPLWCYGRDRINLLGPASVANPIRSLRNAAVEYRGITT